MRQNYCLIMWPEAATQLTDAEWPKKKPFSKKSEKHI